MVGGLSPVRGDVIPFGLVRGNHLIGLNVVGLRRRGATKNQLQRMRQAYRLLFGGDGLFADRVEVVAREFADEPAVGKIIAFIRGGRKRALMRPAAAPDDDAGDDEAS
jgi:UDP-N-acetylglucosamine acyltransferase